MERKEQTMVGRYNVGILTAKRFVGTALVRVMEAWRLEGNLHDHLHDHPQKQNFAKTNVYQLLLGTRLFRRHMNVILMRLT